MSLEMPRPVARRFLTKWPTALQGLGAFASAHERAAFADALGSALQVSPFRAWLLVSLRLDDLDLESGLGYSRLRRVERRRHRYHRELLNWQCRHRAERLLP